MKLVKKVLFSVLWFLYVYSGLKSFVDWVDTKVFVYGRRLRMVPTSFKIFVWTLGVISGSAGMMIYQQSPRIIEDIVKHSEPIVIVNPVLAQIDEVAVSKTVETNRDLADYIWQKESSRGINNFSKCEAIGKINGVGYAIPGDGSYVCFDSHEDEMLALNGWIISKRAAGWSELKMLCTYSGNHYDECKK